jgi:tRNA(Ile)-lysidine synthase
MFSPETFASRFHEYSRTRGLFGKRDSVIAAVSGGVDSMVLLDLLVRERPLRLVAAHFNHRLRGAESDGDEEFVRTACISHGVECRIGRAAEAGSTIGVVNGIQETARRLRYAYLRSVAVAEGGAVIATAHHADDNAETILHHLCRGSGLQGMAGILPSRDGGAEPGRLIRPLLFARRVEIESYAKERRIGYRDDSSNAGDHYTRNVLRHRIIPLLEDLFGPSVIETISRSGELVASAAEYLQNEAARGFQECRVNGEFRGVALSIGRLRNHHPAIRSLIIVKAADFAGVMLEESHVRDIDRLLGLEPGTRVILPAGMQVARERSEIRIEPAEAAENFSIAVEPGRTYEIGGFRFSAEETAPPPEVSEKNPSVEFVDAGSLKQHRMRLRTWRQGDSFIPLGMTGRKKLSDFFVDEKVPINRKLRTPVLETDEGTIVWVCGHRIDDRFKITAATRRAFRLELSPRPGK